MNRRALLFVAALAGAAFGQKAPAPATPESHSLLPNVKVGDKLVYAYRNDVKIGGTEASMQMKITMTIASLEPKGQIVFNNEQSEGTFQRGAQTGKVPDATATTTFRLNGELLGSDPAFSAAEQKRLSRMMQMRVAEKPVRMGDKWSWKEVPNEAGGGVGRQGEAELIAFEERLGVRCAKVHYELKETSGDKPCHGTMDVWFSLKDGLPAEIAVALEDAPFAPGVAGSMKASNRRTNP